MFIQKILNFKRHVLWVGLPVLACITTPLIAITPKDLNRDNTLVIGITKPIPDISGIGDNTIETNQVNFLLYDLLFNFNPRDGYAYTSMLVEKTSKNKNRDRWNLTIKKGIFFHDGSPMTAADVKFSIDMANQPENSRIDFLGIIKEVEVVGRYELVFTLNQPAPRFLEDHLYNVPIIPKKAVERVGMVNFSKNPIGSGPFKFSARKKGNYLILRRNEKYWGGKSPIRHILIRTNLKPDVLNIEIEAGNIDIVPEAPASLKELNVLKKKVRILQPDSLDYFFMGFNVRIAPTSDVRFRKAILHSFNFDRFIAQLFETNNGGIRAYSPIPPSMWPQDREFQTSHAAKYNPKEAERLFKELETDGLLDRSASLTFICRGKRYRKIILRAVANNLAFHYGFTNIHFKVIANFDRFQSTVNTNHIYTFGMGHDNPSPNINIFGQNPYNLSGYEDKEVREWLRTEHREVTKEKRSKYLVNIMRKALYEDYIWGMLFHGRSFFLASKRVNGLIVSGVGYYYIKNAFEKNPIEASIVND